MMYLYCRTLWGDIEGCVVDVDVIVRFNAIEVLRLVADHDMVMVLCICADHFFSDLHVQKSYLASFPL
jgi:hypothetical protein